MLNKEAISKIKILRYGILITSIALIVGGIYRKEVNTIFIKAINICLECIGIG